MAATLEPKVVLVNIETQKEYIPQGMDNADEPDNIISFGEVKAGDKSKVYKLRLWNNKSGQELCSTMRDVELFVLDSNKAKSEPCVTDGWVKVQSSTSVNKSLVELDAVKVLKLNGTGMEEGEISGAVNDGNHETEETKKNYSDFDMYVQITKNVELATHGQKVYFTCIRYFYT